MTNTPSNILKCGKGHLASHIRGRRENKSRTNSNPTPPPPPPTSQSTGMSDEYFTATDLHTFLHYARLMRHYPRLLQMGLESIGLLRLASSVEVMKLAGMTPDERERFQHAISRVLGDHEHYEQAHQRRQRRQRERHNHQGEEEDQPVTTSESPLTESAVAQFGPGRSGSVDYEQKYEKDQPTPIIFRPRPPTTTKTMPISVKSHPSASQQPQPSSQDFTAESKATQAASETTTNRTPTGHMMQGPTQPVHRSRGTRMQQQLESRLQQPPIQVNYHPFPVHTPPPPSVFPTTPPTTSPPSYPSQPPPSVSSSGLFQTSPFSSSTSAAVPTRPSTSPTLMFGRELEKLQQHLAEFQMDILHPRPSTAPESFTSSFYPTTMSSTQFPLHPPPTSESSTRSSESASSSTPSTPQSNLLPAQPHPSDPRSSALAAPSTVSAPQKQSRTQIQTADATVEHDVDSIRLLLHIKPYEYGHQGKDYSKQLEASTLKFEASVPRSVSASPPVTNTTTRRIASISASPPPKHIRLTVDQRIPTKNKNKKVRSASVKSKPTQSSNNKSRSKKATSTTKPIFRPTTAHPRCLPLISTGAISSASLRRSYDHDRRMKSATTVASQQQPQQPPHNNKRKRASQSNDERREPKEEMHDENRHVTHEKQPSSSTFDESTSRHPVTTTLSVQY